MCAKISESGCLLEIIWAVVWWRIYQLGKSMRPCQAQSNTGFPDLISFRRFSSPLIVTLLRKNNVWKIHRPSNDNKNALGSIFIETQLKIKYVPQPFGMHPYSLVFAEHAAIHSSSYSVFDGNTDNVNRFKFSVPLPIGTDLGDKITATATLSNTTSEFSPEVEVRLPTVITNRTITYRVNRN